MRRIGILLSVALPLAALDLWVKAAVPTEPWASHARSYAWLLLSALVLAAMLFVAQVPSPLLAPAAGVLAAGVLGNTLSAVWNGMEVPNPLVLGSEHAVIAFNLADVWALGGICLLVLALGTWLIRRRHLIPSTAAVRRSRGRAFLEVFERAEGVPKDVQNSRH